MRLFALLGSGWSINFSQQTLRGIRAFDPGSRRGSGSQLGRALSLGPGVFIGLLRRPGLSRPRVEPEIERCRPSSENLTIGSVPKMTGVDVKRSLWITAVGVSKKPSYVRSRPPSSMAITPGAARPGVVAKHSEHRLEEARVGQRRDMSQISRAASVAAMAQDAGRMFWLTRKRLAGSYFFFNVASRS
jgi:hypothetical protein